jgi:hypothetical protein
MNRDAMKLAALDATFHLTPSEDHSGKVIEKRKKRIHLTLAQRSLFFFSELDVYIC